MTTELDPTLAPVGDAFEAAYSLPDEFPENLRALHTDLLTRLRNEARAVPMNTIQLMLVERIAYFYVAMKFREQSAETPMSIKETKDMTDFWAKMTSEFLKGLAASQDKARTTLLVEVQNVLRQSLRKIKDPELVRELTSEWNEEFARIDI